MRDFKVINEQPPNFAKIAEAFPLILDKKNILYAYGDTIYSPDIFIVPDWLRAHECIHLDEQDAYGGPERWWEDYIRDQAFRFEQEVKAHRAEFAEYKAQRSDRNEQTFYLHLIAQRLTGPLYQADVEPSKRPTVAMVKTLISQKTFGKRPSNDDNGDGPRYA